MFMFALTGVRDTTHVKVGLKSLVVTSSFIATYVEFAFPGQMEDFMQHDTIPT